MSINKKMDTKNTADSYNSHKSDIIWLRLYEILERQNEFMVI